MKDKNSTTIGLSNECCDLFNLGVFHYSAHSGRRIDASSSDYRESYSKRFETFEQIFFVVTLKKL